MFLNDALQDRGSTGMIPRTFRINDRHWPVTTDAQAVGLRAKNQGFRPGKFEFLQAPLQVFPSFETGFARAAVRLGLIRAEEDMAAERLQAQGFNRPPQFYIRV